MIIYDGLKRIETNFNKNMQNTSFSKLFEEFSDLCFVSYNQL